MDINAALDKAFHDAEVENERQGAIDNSVKAAANGVKVLAPILQAVSAFGASPEDANNLIGKLLVRAHRDTAEVIKAYGLTMQDSPEWLQAMVNGQIVKIITNGLTEGNTAMLDKPGSDYIQPMIQYAEQAAKIGVQPYPKASSELEITSALMMATCKVMNEYQNFNYFHTDARKIAQQVSEYFKTRVIEGTLDPLTDRFGLNPQERSYMANSLLSTAGTLMAQSWKNSVDITISNLKDLDPKARRSSTTSGYSLEAVIENFEKIYQGVELSCESAISTLNPSREQHARAGAGKSPSLA